VVHPGAREDLFPHVAQRRARLFNFNSTLGWVPPERVAQLGIDPEAWQPRVADHYRYALTQPTVDGLLCRLDIEQHVDDLLEAIADGPLTPDEIEHMDVLGGLGAGKAVTK
jgi:hypothetical protein